MRSDELGQLLRAQPFRPFRIHLADGRAFAVQHPDFVARSPTGRSAVVYGPDGAFEILDLVLVSSLEVGAERTG